MNREERNIFSSLFCIEENEEENEEIDLVPIPESPPEAPPVITDEPATPPPQYSRSVLFPLNTPPPQYAQRPRQRLVRGSIMFVLRNF